VPGSTVSTPSTPLPDPRWGVHEEVGATFANGVVMGGIVIAARWRPVRWLGAELGLGIYTRFSAHDITGLDAHVTASAVFFVNPQNPV
jgi:hypothetical protein